LEPVPSTMVAPLIKISNIDVEKAKG